MGRAGAYRCTGLLPLGARRYWPPSRAGSLSCHELLPFGLPPGRVVVSGPRICSILACKGGRTLAARIPLPSGGLCRLSVGSWSGLGGSALLSEIRSAPSEGQKLSLKLLPPKDCVRKLLQESAGKQGQTHFLCEATSNWQPSHCHWLLASSPPLQPSETSRLSTAPGWRARCC